jgi:ribonuclease T1
MERGVKTLWVLMLGLLLWQPLVQANFYSDDADSAGIKISRLPLEARDTFRLIKQGGPFAYSRDGIVFGNRERQLPKRPRGYYHEYTVKTPGAHNRGARRIICGAVPECYYTDDHYQTFKRIKE